MSGGATVSTPGTPSTSTGARTTLAIASLATLATFLDTTILYVAFPDINATFGSSPASELSWVLNGFTIVFAALLIPCGKLADRVGHRRVFLVGSAIFTAASMACGLAPTAELLIVFRVAQAAGAAALIPSSLALVMRAFPPQRITHAVAIWASAGAFAGALGPTLGAAVVEAAGWRWAFYINVPIGIFTIVAGRRVLQESSDPDTKVPSFVGVAMIIVATAVLAYAVVDADVAGWVSVRTIGLLVIGLAGLGAFIAHQQRTRAPVLDLDLFLIPNFRWGNAAAFVFGLAFSALFFGSILFLTEVWGWSILKAGFGVAPGPLFVVLLAPRAGKLAGTIGQRPLMIVGAICYALGGIYRLLLLDGHVDYFRDYLPSMVLTGIGVAFVLPQLSSVVAQATPANRIGVGGAALQAIRQFGGSFGVALTIALLQSSSRTAGFDQVWWIVVIGGAMVTLLVIPIRTKRTAPALESTRSDRT